MNTSTKRSYSLQTIHRALKILRAFSRENTRLTLTELNEITGITKSRLQRLLLTLTIEGLLNKSEYDKRYQLGLEFLFFAELVEKSSSLITIAKPVVERINSETHESVSLSVIEDNERRCIYHSKSKHHLTALTFVGQTSPLYAGASAKTLLAYFSEEELNLYLNSVQFKQITESTIKDKEVLVKQLKKIRELGYGISDGERVKGAMAISAPIFNPFSEIFATLTIIVPSARIDEYHLEELILKIKKGAEEITNKLKL